VNAQPGSIAGHSPATTVVIQYSYLQFLDILTTLAFLLNGVPEANPFVRFALHIAPNPIVALLIVKVAAAALCLLCLCGDRIRTVKRINAFFALIVVWNLLALIVSSAGG